MTYQIRNFGSTAKSNDRRRKNIHIQKKSVYTTKLSAFKSFRIQSSHFQFRIQFRISGEFLFRIRVNDKINPVQNLVLMKKIPQDSL